MGHNRANQTPSPAVPVTLAILVSSFLTLILPERSPDTSSLAPDALAIRLLWNNLCVCVMTGRRAHWRAVPPRETTRGPVRIEILLNSTLRDVTHD